MTTRLDGLGREPPGDLQRRGRRDRHLHVHEHEAGHGDRQEGHGRAARTASATRARRAGTIAVNNGTISADVAPGQYVSTEGAKAGWDLTSRRLRRRELDRLRREPAGELQRRGRRDRHVHLHEPQAGRDHGEEGHAVGGTDTFSLLGHAERPRSRSNNGDDLGRSSSPGSTSSTEAAKAGWDLDVGRLRRRELGRLRGESPGDLQRRGGRDRDVHLHEHEARASHRPEADEPGRRSAVVRLHARATTRTASRSPTGSRTTRATSPRARTRSPRTCRPGWDLDSATCDDGSAPGSIGLAAGETVTCVFTNEKDANIVVAEADEPGRRSAVVQLQRELRRGRLLALGRPVERLGRPRPGHVLGLRERAAGLGSRLGDLRRRAATRARSRSQAGETVTCVFTNEKDASDHRPEADEPERRSAGRSRFTASYDQDGFSLSDGQSNDSGDLDPGTYSVSENVPAGWDLSSVVCSDEQASGCDRARRGRDRDVRLHEHEARHDHRREADGPEQGVRQLLVQRRPPPARSATAARSSCRTSCPARTRRPRPKAQGWSLTSISCDDDELDRQPRQPDGDVPLEAGEIVKCTFANAKLGQGSIDVSKSANPTTREGAGRPGDVLGDDHEHVGRRRRHHRRTSSTTSSATSTTTAATAASTCRSTWPRARR